MVSEKERLNRELEEARTALEYVKNDMQHGMDKMFELETTLRIEKRHYLLHMNADALEQRVERLERDLKHLEEGTWD
jgi:chromosome segregation ATPase